MSDRRMFSKRIIKSSRFLQMPESSQNLYFHMALDADDDGVVETYPIMQILGTQPDNLKILIGKGFVIQINEDQVCFIKDWKEHNVIRADRKVDSIYKPILDKLGIETLEAKPRSDVEDNTKRLGGPSTDGIGQVKLSKDNKTENSDDFESFWSLFPSRRKGGRKTPRLRWDKLSNDTKQLILQDLPKRVATHKDWLKNNGDFIPAPEVYLNKEQWLMPIVATQELSTPRTVDRFTI